MRGLLPALCSAHADVSGVDASNGGSKLNQEMTMKRMVFSWVFAIGVLVGLVACKQ